MANPSTFVSSAWTFDALPITDLISQPMAPMVASSPPERIVFQISGSISAAR